MYFSSKVTFFFSPTESLLRSTPLAPPLPASFLAAASVRRRSGFRRSAAAAFFTGILGGWARATCASARRGRRRLRRRSPRRSLMAAARRRIRASFGSRRAPLSWRGRAVSRRSRASRPVSVPRPSEEAESSSEVVVPPRSGGCCSVQTDASSQAARSSSKSLVRTREPLSSLKVLWPLKALAYLGLRTPRCRRGELRRAFRGVGRAATGSTIIGISRSLSECDWSVSEWTLSRVRPVRFGLGGFPFFFRAFRVREKDRTKSPARDTDPPPPRLPPLRKEKRDRAERLLPPLRPVSWVEADRRERALPKLATLKLEEKFVLVLYLVGAERLLVNGMDSNSAVGGGGDSRASAAAAIFL
mmetsp:Transcript_32562/g.64559  ORF Transcript_32562/g.64559 Transcript_32562/m.64559 type:complete len:358 (-) Transcript_32562:657-1730(-)